MAGATQKDLKDLALTWAREQLADAPLIRVGQLAASRGLTLESVDLAEVDQLIGRLQVVLPDPKAAKAYRTVIASRYPNRKGHMTLGTARGAVGYSWGPGVRGGEIWELENGIWNLLYDIKPGTQHADLPWIKK